MLICFQLTSRAQGLRCKARKTCRPPVLTLLVHQFPFLNSWLNAKVLLPYVASGGRWP